MNKQRQEQIKAEIDAIRKISRELTDADLQSQALAAKVADERARVDAIREAEEKAFEKLPESVQYSAKGEFAEECIGIMEEALDTFDELAEAIFDEENTVKDLKDIFTDIVNLLQDTL